MNDDIDHKDSAHWLGELLACIHRGGIAWQMRRIVSKVNG